MTVPNWIHHSKKEAKRKLKPQALRSARERRRALIRKIRETPLKGGFFINKNKNAYETKEGKVKEGKVCLAT